MAQVSEVEMPNAARVSTTGAIQQVQVDVENISVEALISLPARAEEEAASKIEDEIIEGVSSKLDRVWSSFQRLKSVKVNSSSNKQNQLVVKTFA